ncbi:hypothetical protein MSAN_02213700 [Mycena sanguinolenta]|uniref:Uncharacterized protein n=1 Tax=Mycena sanguinolenta TaxID=230812 RepID=A0A8H7CIP0_9AGAR|nr:hypothetical protein MSAN_02213700 [Mycena sanguinolenta]
MSFLHYLPIMDEKPKVRPGRDAAYEELQHENQRLRAEGDRVRRERDAAADGLVASKKEVAELEHKITMQGYAIGSLKAELQALKEVSVEKLRPPVTAPPAAPRPPQERTDVIEISDDEAGSHASERQEVPATTLEAVRVTESRPGERETRRELGGSSSTLQFVDLNKTEAKRVFFPSNCPACFG